MGWLDDADDFVDDDIAGYVMRNKSWIVKHQPMT
jgi:hypothetical protein